MFAPWKPCFSELYLAAPRGGAQKPINRVDLYFWFLFPPSGERDAVNQRINVTRGQMIPNEQKLKLTRIPEGEIMLSVGYRQLLKAIQLTIGGLPIKLNFNPTL